MSSVLSRRDSLLLDEFRQFYGEVMRKKHLVRFRAAAIEEQERLWQDLVTYLEKRRIAAEHRGPKARLYEEAQYVMAALADEISLHLKGVDAETWKRHLLEDRLFNSHIAGDRFFERIETLLFERDSAYTELAAVYLFALALGFGGKYRADEKKLAEYRGRLFSFIAGRDPGLVEAFRHLFPNALKNTVRNEPVRRLPRARPWLLALLLGVVAYVFIAHFVWNQLTSVLRGVL